MKELLKRLTISILLGANLCTILLLWTCIALTYVSPDVCPRLSLLTLAFPVFLIADLLFIILWLLFKARLAWVPIAGALLAGSYILDYCPLNPTANHADTDSTTITIVSFNVGHMKDDQQREGLLTFLTTTDADIICLQELSKSFLTNHQEWLDTAAYHYLQSGNDAIITRLPILSDTISIPYPTRSNHSTACWIDCHGDSLLVVNNHLESNHLSPQEQDEYTNTITDPHKETIKSSSRMLLKKLSEAAAFRGAQADSIRSLALRNANHPVIVCGDFNDTPISYTYQRLARQLHSAYRQTGLGPGFTYSRRSFPVRIDHLFYSKHWTCHSCHIDNTVTTSDHYPLIVRLSKKMH
ncbi:MAG: endonuclease/exonuclease/phosphatase family protein [Bacteroidaceae bacterium]|nr:endonuclease/exonuclease/phosphatase family protein [Bacteroidaceae bacterium]MBQ8454013.1 endonuclease/exonuclease/phosphatase family protein [Bacteroidaceae bacterium]MBQ9169993.1 endonuclease/exonuclease/phosphatase family protein [Bacteroidaceae bacterium]MBQ9294596.1 endonuclease/exonuclease/phosphatase family protein [Bacteroidaceae bacterium]